MWLQECAKHTYTRKRSASQLWFTTGSWCRMRRSCSLTVGKTPESSPAMVSPDTNTDCRIGHYRVNGRGEHKAEGLLKRLRVNHCEDEQQGDEAYLH